MKKILIILICLILTLLFLFRLNLIKENLFDGLIGALIGSGLLSWIAWKELESMNNTTNADFIHKLKNDFFTSRTRKLFILVDLKAVKFITKNDDIIYFEVEEEKIKNQPERIKKRLQSKKIYSSYDVDDILLGPLEDIGLFLRKKIIKIEMTYPEFGYYVMRVYENEEIKKYIEYLRKEEENRDAYENLEFLYNECKKFESCKSCKKSKLIFKLKCLGKQKN